MKLPCALLFTVALTTAMQPATAQDGLVGFRSPSNNIHCQFFAGDAGSASVVRCDILKIETRPRRPADCDLEWGQAYEISANGRSGAPICYGDTVADPRLPVLAYGSVWQHGGFTCKSETTGVTCFNADRRGFALSRARQQVF